MDYIFNMKFSLLHTFFIFVFFIGSLAAQNLFDVSEITTIEIVFEQSNWDSILHEYWYDAEGERLLSSVIINGQEFDSVGVRYKGFSSYDKDYAKKPLNIRLDYILSNQSYDGIETLKLSNGWRDPSIIREVLAYEIARDYMPASRANFVQVYINNDYYGIYSSAETVDKNFIEKHFYENKGIFFKGTAAQVRGGGFKGKADFRYVGTAETQYINSYELKSDSGWADLIELCDILNNYIDDIETVLNVDRALWFLAFHNLLVSLDSPVAAPRNFYIYKDRNGIFQIIPWDLNMAFGTYSLVDGRWDHTAEELQELDPLYHQDSEEYHLVRQLLQNNRYQKMYLAHMRTILDEKFLSGWYGNRALYLQSVIDQAVQLDNKKHFSYEDFHDNIGQTINDGQRDLVGIAELMEGRKDYLDNHSLFTALAPKISNTNFNLDTYDSDSTIIITSKIDHANWAQFVYRSSTNSSFIKVRLYDDGAHGDSGPNDGVFGASIQHNSNRIQYYFYAENNSAAKFSPEGAAYKFHELQIQSNLVINEFLALNDTTHADQDEEFDDWIELYNNTDTIIFLSNYFLSDNAENVFKWQFPDTSIDPLDYLIVWADENVDQTGLHANFKLSGSGEVLFLVNPDSQVIDEAVFGEQSVDISYGRLPNGRGEFTTLIPSFSSENLVAVTDSEDVDPEIPDDFSLRQNYPNPFNPTTTISWQLKIGGHVNLSIYNILGQKVITLVDEEKIAGDDQVEWDASGFPSGIFFYRLQTDDYQEVKKAILIR
jgi:hypothetical protein